MICSFALQGDTGLHCKVTLQSLAVLQQFSRQVAVRRVPPPRQIGRPQMHGIALNGTALQLPTNALHCSRLHSIFVSGCAALSWLEQGKVGLDNRLHRDTTGRNFKLHKLPPFKMLHLSLFLVQWRPLLARASKKGFVPIHHLNKLWYKLERLHYYNPQLLMINNSFKEGVMTSIENNRIKSCKKSFR